MAAKFALVSVALIACAVAEPYGHGWAYGRRAYGYGYGYADGAPAYHPYGGVSYTARSPQGLSGYGRYRREAEAEPGLGLGYYGRPAYGYGYGYADGAPAYHPYGGVSYTARSPQGASGYLRYKREAEAEAEPEAEAEAEPEAEASLGYYGNYGYGPYSYGYAARPYGYGYRATSYEYRSPQGLTGYYGRYKRSAEPSLGYYGYGGYGYGSRSYQSVSRALPGYGGISEYSVSNAHPYGAAVYDRRRTPVGLHKREAEAEPGYSFQEVNRQFGYGGASSYRVNTAGYSGRVHESRALPYYQGYNYGFYNY